jgi:hypothetical protein
MQWITSLGIFLKGGVDRRPGLRARDWNERIVAPCVAAHLMPGAHTEVVRTARGQVINIDPSLGWPHPWFVSGAGWDRTGFRVRVRPGFVNGEPPRIGEQTLLEGPVIPIRGAWRPVDGTDDRIPGFFEKLGVRRTSPGFEVTAAGGVRVDTTQREFETPPRRLMACDLWVSVARATFRPQIDILDPTGVTGQVVDYSVTFDVSNLERVGTAPRLQLGRFVPVRPPTLAERLMSMFQDDGEDRILISTLYMLGPVGVMEYGPTPQWSFYRANNCFWNLHHAARNVPPPRNPAPLRIFTGLLGGIGDIIGNQLLSQVNEFSDRVRNAVNNTTNEGRFWIA